MTSTPANLKPTDALTLIGTSSPEVRARLESWRSTVTHELTQRPIRTLSLVFGAGYLLGGGLFSRLTWRAAKLALRFGPTIALSLGAGDDGPVDSVHAPRTTTDRNPSSKKRKPS